MPHTTIARTSVATLKDFYDLMAATREVRAEAVAEICAGRAAPDHCAASLARALASLEDAPGQGGKYRLILAGDKSADVDFDYEIGELKKDILFLEQGEAALLAYLAELHPDFDAIVAEGVARLGGRKYRTFVSDRDGTTNNYCGRYRSSIQSAYNAVFLVRFARSCAAFPIFLTSAPLEEGGIVDVSVGPPRSFVYAASKGREFIGLDGVRRHYPIDAAKQAALDGLNARLSALLGGGEYEKYTLIGSGLQFKFGQTTVARQDIGGSIDADESLAFLETLRALAAEADPDGRTFCIEDTGLDVEIILTVEAAGAAGEAGALKDFDKAEGVKYLDGALGMDMAAGGPHLVCGDTGSDVPMLEAALEFTDDVWSVFVTRKEALADRVQGLCRGAFVVPEPDMLVTMLGKLG